MARKGKAVARALNGVMSADKVVQMKREGKTSEFIKKFARNEGMRISVKADQILRGVLKV